jgi:hypothetical protein
MEGFEFAASALNFASADKIALLKVVSDNCDGRILNNEIAKELLAPHTNSVVNFIENIIATKEQKSLLSEELETSLREIAKSKRLTFSKTNQLLEKAKSQLRQNNFKENR